MMEYCVDKWDFMASGKDRRCCVVFGWIVTGSGHSHLLRADVVHELC